MKYFFTLLFFSITFGLYGQIQHEINNQSGTFGNLLTDIDSISFDLDLGMMIVVLNNGNILQHSISEVINVTFSEHDGPFPPGTVHCDPDNPTEIIEVMNPATGRIWMDRNLGASRVAESSTDSLAFGDLYQWGRRSDGHQCRNSSATIELSNFDQPGHGDFILSPSQPSDWRIERNDDLWNGVNAVNNPCPIGYRLPTSSELNEERMSWSSNNAAGAFNSPLRLPVAGARHPSEGSLRGVGINGRYWTNSVSSNRSRTMKFDNSNAIMDIRDRASGRTIRCIWDEG